MDDASKRESSPSSSPEPNPSASAGTVDAGTMDAGAMTVLTAAGEKADLVKRFVAAIIDGAVASVIGMIPVIGGLIGLTYILLRDGFEFDFMDYRSVGKKLMKLRPVKDDGTRMTLRDSFQRNWPLVFGSLVQILIFIPVIGWILIPFVALAGLALGIAEIVLVFTNPEGRRWGDRLAATKVVEVTA